MRASLAKTLLWCAVLGHFAVTLVHGAAHAAASVPMSAAANAFILLIIEAGPLLGLLVVRRKHSAGVWMIAATMTGALVFGVVNHFVIAGVDHVSHIIPEWRGLFTATAVILAVTEAGGVAAALWYRSAILSTVAAGQNDVAGDGRKVLRR